jgi:RNA polymerase sigma factor (sigma-70 family)
VPRGRADTPGFDRWPEIQGQQVTEFGVPPLPRKNTQQEARIFGVGFFVSWLGRTNDSVLVSRLRNRIAKVLKTLTYREREIIKLRYGLGDSCRYTLEEVGHIFKVTSERIRQIEAKAVRKLQQPSRSQELVGFLD